MQTVYVVGSKSLGAYGGYETFVKKLVECHKDNDKVKYVIACKANGSGSMDESELEGAETIDEHTFTYCGALCFKINIPEIGPAQAIYYDMKALDACCKHIEQNHVSHPIVYILACRIGLVMKHYVKKIHSYGGKVYLNPDGHEWKREKWSRPIRAYWKISERLMVKHSDYIICDNRNIEKYIHEEYSKFRPKTTYIAYGSDIVKSKLSDDDEKYVGFLKNNDLEPRKYYLIVGRFVPENNYATMIKEFMASHTDKKLAIITTPNGDLYNELERTLHFTKDERIVFAGTVYDDELLKKIRENAYAYIHGHEVGGTNPSLLEALGSTDLNLVFGVNFNREVGKEAALYWEKDEGDLSGLIEKAEKMSPEEIEKMGKLAKHRVSNDFKWEYISEQYSSLFEWKLKYKK